MAGKMGVGTGETEQTILSRLDSDIQEQRVRVGYLSTYIWDKKEKNISSLKLIFVIEHWEHSLDKSKTLSETSLDWKMES